MSRDDDDDEQVKCRNEFCFCEVSEDEVFCSERCRKASKSERPSYECKCDHEDCDEEE